MQVQSMLKQNMLNCHAASVQAEWLLNAGDHPNNDPEDPFMNERIADILYRASSALYAAKGDMERAQQSYFEKDLNPEIINTYLEYRRKLCCCKREYFVVKKRYQVVRRWYLRAKRLRKENRECLLRAVWKEKMAGPKGPLP